jgi:hypothetical protein
MQRAFLGLSMALLAYLAIPAKLIAEDAAENVKGGNVGSEKREPDKTIVELREHRLKQARLLQDEIATRFGETHIEIIAGDSTIVSGTVKDSDQVAKILRAVEFRAIQMGLLSLSDYSAGGGVVNSLIAGRAPFSTDKPAAHNATSNELPRAPLSTEPRFIPHSPRFDIPPRMPKAPVLCLA